MRVVYMGTPEFAVPALDALIAAGHDVVGVFTNPDRPSGRGKVLTASPVKQCAVRHGIEVCQPERFRGDETALAQLTAWAPDCAVVAAYGQILPQSALDVPRLGCVNIHASLLPRYRGAAPINWCLIRGETRTGITTMQMEAGLDSGPILMTAETSIGELETAGSLHDRLMVIGAELIVATLAGLAAGTLTAQPQDHSQATYAPMLSKDTGRVDWTQPARDVANLVRGVNPWPGAFTHHEDRRVKLHLCRPIDGISGAPGEIVEAGRRLIVACGVGAVECLQLQAPGKQPMAALDFLNGFRLAAGERFQ